ncbi:MAG: hypothetical protein H7Y38_13730 [Armatimonadetes bacterium]|nr:hypothetical protein [Armatimonadota bacterium]
MVVREYRRYEWSYRWLLTLCAVMSALANGAAAPLPLWDGVYFLRRESLDTPPMYERVRVRGGKITERTKIAPVKPYYSLTVSPNERFFVYVAVSHQSFVLDVATGKTRRLPLTQGQRRNGYWSPDGNILPLYGDGVNEYQIVFVDAVTASVASVGSGKGHRFRSVHWIKNDSMVYSLGNASTSDTEVEYFRATLRRGDGKIGVAKEKISAQTAQKLTGIGAEKIIREYQRGGNSSIWDAASYPVSPKQGKMFGVSETLQEQAAGDTLPLWAGNNYVYYYHKGVSRKNRVYMNDIYVRPLWTKSERYLVYKNATDWHLLDPMTGKEHDLVDGQGIYSGEVFALFAD